MRDLPLDLGVMLVKYGILVGVMACCSVGAVFLFAAVVAWLCN